MLVSSLFSSENDLQAMRQLIQRLPQVTIVDFEELMQLPSVRSVTKIWQQAQNVVGFAYVDDYNNLWFEAEHELAELSRLEDEIIEWGVTCLQQRNAQTDETNTLDASCPADNLHRLQVLEQHGFVRQPIRSLRYARSIVEPLPDFPLPIGFTVRSVVGPQEIDRLVALHRAAFGTDHMTAEYRSARMNAPQYDRSLDLVAVSPNGDLAAFCVCGFSDERQRIGYTDPIGTHPQYQHLGLGQGVVGAGLIALRAAGAMQVELGTSSENMPMQKLAEKLGFACVSEKWWLTRSVG